MIDTLETQSVTTTRAVQPASTIIGDHSRCVLVVDDDPQIRQLLLETFGLWGYTAWAAQNGTEAIELFRRIGDDLDLLILDVRMPGLDGPQTLAAMRRTGPVVPCCFMSGDFGSYSGAELIDSGAQGILQKPFTAADLARTISRLTCSASHMNSGGHSDSLLDYS